MNSTVPAGRPACRGATPGMLGVLGATLGALVACGGDKHQVDPEQLATCARAIERASVTRNGDASLELTAGCSAACPALAAFAAHGSPADADGDPVAALLAGCGWFCSPEAEAAWRRAVPTERFAALTGVCDVASYGLAEGQEHLVSVPWLVLRRVHAWLRKHRGAADSATREALDQAGRRALFVLPLPAYVPDVYRLPLAGARKPSRAAVYVVAGARQLRAGLAPVARLLPAELERRAERFPGPVLADPEADFLTLMTGVESAGFDARDRVPLLLIDRDAPASRVASAAGALGQPRVSLAVAGYSAQAHPIVIEALATAGSAAPLLKVGRDAYVVIGVGEDLRIPILPDGRDELAHRLTALSVRWAPQNKIEIQLPPDGTVAELAEVLDIVARTKFSVALLHGE